MAHWNLTVGCPGAEQGIAFRPFGLQPSLILAENDFHQRRPAFVSSDYCRGELSKIFPPRTGSNNAHKPRFSLSAAGFR